MQGFECETIIKKSVNMFKHMEIAEIIYKIVVEPSSKQYTRADVNCAGHSRKMRVESASSKIYSGLVKPAGELKQRYVDNLMHWSKLTCLIHVLGNSSYECNLL